MRPEFEVTLQEMTFGGDAFGRLPDGRALFVPFGLPGELVRIFLTEEKSSFVRGKILEIIKPSLQRIQAKCPHFGSCGGCNYQHLDYPTQLEVKQQIVKSQLQRLAGLKDYPVAAVVPSPDQWNYRNSVHFHVSRNGKLGYQRAGSNELIEISECHLPAANINALWPQLGLEAASGVERLQIREGLEGDLILGLESQNDLPSEFTVDFPISVVWKGPDSQFILAGEDCTLMQVKDRSFRVSIGSFFQANSLQTASMVDHVISLAGELKGKIVIDAYCGVGLFSAFLAGKAKKLIGIEVSESSCNDFAVNLDEFDNVELYIDQAENVLPVLEIKPDVVILDPPRAGLDARVVSALAESKPGKIIYVSCDPATLARDIKRLIQNGFELKSVTPFDQFPQTYHIECVACLEFKPEE
jgi:23S rRNA (uracil1939-C5)-methyltransferase